MVGELAEQLGGLDREPGAHRSHHGVAELGQQVGRPGQVPGLGLEIGQLGVLLLGLGQAAGRRVLPGALLGGGDGGPVGPLGRGPAVAERLLVDADGPFERGRVESEGPHLVSEGLDPVGGDRGALPVGLEGGRQDRAPLQPAAQAFGLGCRGPLLRRPACGDRPTSSANVAGGRRRHQFASGATWTSAAQAASWAAAASWRRRSAISQS